MAPADEQTRRDILRGLRLGTVPRTESDAEARAVFDKLVFDLRDVPADILSAGCNAYVNTPGTRFFPRGAGEIRAFTQPLMTKRMRRAWRLKQLAKASDEAFDESTRCTPEAAAEIMEELGLRTETRAQLRQHLGPPRKPTRQDYIALGVDPATLDAPKTQGNSVS
jgi:hypothetical protein